MAGSLAALAGRIATAPTEAAALEARTELVRWAEHDLVPHARAEEQAMYPLAHQDSRARLLVEAMLAEHELIVGLVERLRSAPGRVEAAGEARALSVTFESHLAKENDQILPLLAESPGVSLAGALEGMHELLGGHDHDHDHEHDHEHDHGHDHGNPASQAGSTSDDTSSSGCGGGCACGESDGPDLPELDARSVPHAIRHATIFGALDSVSPGGGLVLVAPHDPLPLLRQLEGRAPGAFAVDYLERGPETWRLRFVRA
jgi:uncharacterized protein (DUF2249 family)/iron-sulfur cluster repair protein YtfE (RIC family)